MKRILTFLLLGVLALCFSGCDLAFEKTGDEVTLNDQHGNELIVPMEQIQDLGEPELIEQYFERHFPETYAKGDAAPAELEATSLPGDVKPTAEAQNVATLVGAVPVPGADVLSLALNGILGIGSIWLTKRLRTAQKISLSSVRGIDTFRDILDQTEGGRLVDEELTKSLRVEQEKLKVVAEVGSLMRRYATPTKPTGGIKGLTLTTE